MTTPTFEMKWIFFASSRFVCSDSTIVCCWYMGLAKIAGSGDSCDIDSLPVMKTFTYSISLFYTFDYFIQF